MTGPPRDHYHSYLLRLWRDGDGAPWRAMVQETLTGQRTSFDGLAALVAFLAAETGEPPDEEERGEKRP